MSGSDPRVYVKVSHRDALEGIEAHAASRGGWEILLRPGFIPEEQFLPRVGHLDGILVTGGGLSQQQPLAARGVPLVYVGGTGPSAGAPHVRCDEAAVGRLAAKFFLDRGFENLAFVHQVRAPFSLARGQGFVERGNAAGAQTWTDLPLLDAEDQGRGLFEGLDTWLAGLPRPVGLFASAMSGAVHVVQTCRRAGLSVPEEVAVLGLGRDELRARLCTPELSTLDQNDVGVGRRAAALLEEMMGGGSVPPGEALIQPVGIQQRGSTDVVAVADPHVRQALAFIRDHAREGINVSDVVSAVPASRRVLERSMRDALGRTLLEEIVRIRLETARRMLRETERSVHQVALASGFAGPARMAKVFRREVGMTPSAYRRQSRGG